MVSKIIRVPEKLYIETLIVGRNNSALIVDELQSHKIPVPSNDMKAIYEEVVQSDPRYFNNPALEPSDAWIKKLKLSPMYYYRFKKGTSISLQGCEGAFRMLEDPKMVRYINALAINGVPKEDIELILNAKYNISYETPDFDVFLQFFANYEGWTYQDKELFISTYPDPDLKRLYKEALKNDRAQLIWELGLGTDPSASFDSMMRDMFTDSYFYFKKDVKFNTDNAHKFAQLAIKLADRMDQMADKEKEGQDLFEELKFKLVTDNTKNKKTSKIVDLKDMDVELPERTEKVIPDLNMLIDSEGKE